MVRKVEYRTDVQKRVVVYSAGGDHLFVTGSLSDWIACAMDHSGRTLNNSEIKVISPTYR